MAEVTAALVKELRGTTGAGMMDCKKALSESGGDMDAAVDWLRKKGLSAAARKAGRVAAEGLVGVRTDGGRGAMVEVNSETDFVARNEQFQQFVSAVAEVALASDGSLESLLKATYPGGSRTIAEEVSNLIATIGENITLRRVSVLSVPEGVVAGYVHNQSAPGLGRIGVLVSVQSSGETGGLEGLGKQLAMHVAAAQPQFLDINGVDGAALERERNVLSEQAKASGRPDEIIAKMVEGRLRKYYEEVVLLEQTFVVDNESKISKVVEAVAERVGTTVSIGGFMRFGLGEGVARKEDDFAAEVAKLSR